jgi:hypothetical protein
VWLKYRGWILGVGLLAIAAIGTLVAIRVSAPKLDAAGMASYMPQDEAAVFYMDVAAVRMSGLLEKLAGSAVAGSAVAEEPEYRKFVEQSGFDYKRDLDRVMLQTAGETHLLLLEGRFDWDKLEAYAKAQGGSCEGGFCSVPASTPGRIISFHSLGSSLMAFASSPDSKAAAAISRRTPAKPAYVIPDGPLWLNVPTPYLRQQQNGLPSGTRLFAKALENSERVVFSLGPEGERFELKMDVTAKTVEDAVVLQHQLQGITQLLQKLIARENQTPSKQDLSGILTAGAFDRQSEHVIGRWPIEKSFLETLAPGSN